MSTYFVTDAHLGSGADSRQRERELVNFLSSVEADCDRLILLGDIFDFWFTYKYVVPKGFVRLLGKLADMVDKGIEVHYFIGNHDMWMFDYLEKEIGIFMHDEPCDMTIDGKLFHMGHGDGLCGRKTHNRHDKHYLVLKAIFRCRLNQRLFSWVNPRISFGIACGWSDSSRKSHGTKYDHYLGDQSEGIVLHCRQKIKERPYDYFVFGHRHLPMEMDVETAKYINAGDWIGHRNYVRFDGSEAKLLEYTPTDIHQE